MLLLDFHADETSASAHVESHGLGELEPIDEALDLINDIVGLTEVNSAGPLIVAFWTDNVIEIADIFSGWIL